MSNISKRKKDGSRARMKSMGDHKEFLKRITKSLYYGQLPSLPCISMPVTEVSCEVWSEWHRGRSVRRLHADAAASITRAACVSPAALVLAMLYLERLRTTRPNYLTVTPPADLFLVTLMVSNKFLQDDGEDDEVICSEWAASGGMELNQLKRLELEFLNAIDWNVFVSNKSFETGLQWLERRVALKQAGLRGFFTYSDLACSCDAALDEMCSALCAAGAGAALLAAGWLCGALSLVAAALLLRAAAPLTAAPLTAAPTTPAVPASLLTVDTNIITHSYSSPNHVDRSASNCTDDSFVVPNMEKEAPTADRIECCTGWLKHRQRLARRSWPESPMVHEWKLPELSWTKISILNWLYRNSFVDPMQRWLDKINEYADFIKSQLPLETPSRYKQCTDYNKIDKVVGYTRGHKCVRQWLNFSKFSALVGSMSDR